ncbi:MAG: pyrroloquinoline quinone biosynthesis peptide chaperone PqqD [Gemmatimonadaceae bacterium]|nr:pyrroloquinoline quinone biosynthesis peptide chaperone PqqD [Acetobacteraceae bacterium]
MTAIAAVDTVPAFNRGFRLRHDPVRQAWVVLAPERLFLLDEPAVEILKLVDGVRSVPAIVDALAIRYDAPREAIAADVEAMLRDLADKGAIRL